MPNKEERPALDGVRVLDASRGIAGPLAGMILGDYGAEVIRLDDTADAERAGAVMWHRNKTIVPTDRGPGLASGADLVLTTDARTASALGLDLNDKVPAGVVHLHLPMWHDELDDLDPYTRDRMVSAEFGAARRQTSFSGGPVDAVYPFLSSMQGAWGATCGVAGLVERVRIGRGQRVVVDPLHGSMVATITTMLVSPDEPLPDTSVGPGGPNPTFGTYRCADGLWLFLGALGSRFQDIVFEHLGTADIVTDPRIDDVRERLYAPDNRRWVRARLTEAFARRTRAEWLQELTAAGCPVSPVGDRDDWLDHPQVRAIRQRVELKDPIVGETVMGGVAAELSRGGLPQHRPRAYVEDATWNARRAELPAPLTGIDAPTCTGPLAGIRVADLGTVLAGPYAGMLLAALGADVAKVETVTGDELRLRGYGIARGQRGLGINLREPDGYAAFLRLVAVSDVVLDNYRPGVLSRLKIDDATLRQTREDIVTTSITGYGEVGPMATQPGYDPVVQALSGMMTAQGGDTEPVFSTLAINDVTVACLAALGTCVALYQRAVGRGGQHVTSSLAVAATFMQSGELVRYAGRPAAETGGRDFPGPGPLDRFHACADGWVRVHLSTEQAVGAGLLRAGEESLPAEELTARVGEVIATLPSTEVIAAVTDAGGVAVRARDFREVVNDPALLADGHVAELVWPDGNSTYLPHRLATIGNHPPHPVLKATGHGEFSRELLAEAGLAESEIEALIDAGSVVVGPPMHSVVGVGYR